MLAHDMGWRSRLQGGPSPVHLHCGCGLVVGCGETLACTPRCPWREGCGAHTIPLNQSSLDQLATLQTRCPACGKVSEYERSGFPLSAGDPLPQAVEPLTADIGGRC